MRAFLLLRLCLCSSHALLSSYPFKKTPIFPALSTPPKSPCIVTFRPQRTNLQSRFRERPIINDDIYHSHPSIHSPTPTAPLFTPPKKPTPHTKPPLPHPLTCPTHPLLFRLNHPVSPPILLRPPHLFPRSPQRTLPPRFQRSSPPSTQPANLILIRNAI